MMEYVILFIIVIFFALLISGFFYPDLLTMLKEKFTGRTMLYVGIAIALTVAIISGFLPTILGATGGSGAPTGPEINMDIITLIGGMLIFIIVLIIAAATTLKSK